MSHHIERTLIIVKPDAVAAGHTGKIIDRFLAEGFRLVAMKMICLSEAGARAFYYVHDGKPFFADLVDFMSSGPIVPMVFEAPNAINRAREILGATDPQEAAPGTLRQLFAVSKGHNAVHGSDAPATAAFEIGFYFSKLEQVG